MVESFLTQGLRVRADLPVPSAPDVLQTANPGDNAGAFQFGYSLVEQR
jgi:hypothetical protein